MFSVASPDYIEKYSNFILSHRRFCLYNGIDYFVEADPLEPDQDRTEWYWRKIKYIKKYFDKGYDFVIVVDTDLFFLKRAPDIRTLLDNKNCLYIANGKSGDPNSGFVIVKNNKKGKHYVDTVLSYRPISSKWPPRTGGENGSVIQYIKNYPKFVKIIDRKWNYTERKNWKSANALHFTKQLRGKLKPRNLNDYVEKIDW